MKSGKRAKHLLPRQRMTSSYQGRSRNVMKWQSRLRLSLLSSLFHAREASLVFSSEVSPLD
ncbi:uncharacterized protein L969DRAFT_91574 [Mixia osmundae IAM 14324]|uniref:Uncharacterized protein n=1 Tax=Mixia osmundae (strain CBS 9802 / IAM 14324 / JCM 22182 / KY 12970) TaxID=764103 RepID=G7DZV8_MIXOS|nr:uncharacterized protein L969DRAFT_91574 [Mixia osmundae IAM 14324]KEI42111.1 hypothetical protein L969DRAFT_91574 [Mixia osmundae IAM 14324]GAA96118.1 hypothetical protein E5Q_02779 [Mixia osmundae IAM 14324]